MGGCWGRKILRQRMWWRYDICYFCMRNCSLLRANHQSCTALRNHGPSVGYIVSKWLSSSLIIRVPVCLIPGYQLFPSVIISLFLYVDTCNMCYRTNKRISWHRLWDRRPFVNFILSMHVSTLANRFPARAQMVPVPKINILSHSFTLSLIYLPAT